MTQHPNETPEPLAQEHAGEYRSLYELSGCITDANTMLIGRYELKAKDAEIAGLKAELDKTNMLFAVSCNHGAIREMDAKAQRYDLLRRGQHWSVIDGIGDTLRAEELDAAIDAMKGEAA